MAWKSILLYSFLLLFCRNLYGQNKAELIKAIRKDFQAINNDTALKKKILQNEEFLENMPDGGGELTGYYKDNSIVKIIEWIGISYGNRTREFYFKNGKLFFVYEKFQSFITNDSTGEMDHFKLSTTFEGRYYFNKDKLIEQKLTGKRKFEDESVSIMKELQEAAKENSKLLRQKKG